MKYFIVLILSITISYNASSQIFQKIKDQVKQTTEQRSQEEATKATNKTADRIDTTVSKVITKTKTKSTKQKSKGKDTSKSNETENIKNESRPDQEIVNSESGGNSNIANVKAYQNYDFIPGDKILFEDHFSDERDGEFPSHWQLENGQGQLNKIEGEEAMFLTEGNYATIKPRMKTEKYLTDPFTVEYDYYNKDHAYGLLLFLKKNNPDNVDFVEINQNEVSYTDDAFKMSKSYTDGLSEDNFVNKWHHVAIAVKDHQLKVYVDQNRVLVVPDTKADFFSLGFGGLASEQQPLIFKNVKISSGGGMNMIGKKFTDSKIVTHGINFDVDKSTIKPESMGTLNMIVQILNDNPEVKFEIDGHTDNSGSPSHNLLLSQQRAESVKAQLITLGINESRLTVRGLGDTKPITENNSLEGKANNRRVEFVRM